MLNDKIMIANSVLRTKWISSHLDMISSLDLSTFPMRDPGIAYESLDDITDDCINIKSTFNLSIILVGDCGARTGTLKDVLEIEEEIIDYSDDFDVITNSKPVHGSLGVCTDRCNLTAQQIMK